MEVDNKYDANIVPFLKWAGGKRWLLKRNDLLAPVHYKTYLEPFLGGGSVFLSLPTSHFVLSDLNAELIDCYKAIRDNYKDVEKHLAHHQNMHSDDYYYHIRALGASDKCIDAARFIYLNRTCFNGLYRVNLSGKFNVPRGTKNTVLLDTDNFSALSNRLKKGKIVSQDFEKTIALAGKDDFLFIDPPYTVNHNLNGFIKYNEKIFSWNDQVRLKNCVVAAFERGAMITLTNADHKSIIDLYSGIGEITKVSRNSVIGGKSSSRSKTSEIILRIGWSAD
jgi:DNA adenine methylase